MSRSMGDFHAKKVVPGLIAEPDVLSIPLKGTSLIITASDGLWEIVSSREAVSLAWKEYQKSTNAKMAANATALALGKLVLSRASSQNYKTDDTTILVNFLNSELREQNSF